MPKINRCPIILLSLAMGLTLLATGCGGGKAPGQVDTAKVTGTVKYKDNPVKGVTVTFMPAESKDTGSQGKGNAAYGMTDANGAYTLRTFNPEDGAVPGSYIVTVTKFETIAAEEAPDVDSADYNPDAPAAPPKPPKNELP